jgi:hypothetical protein
VIPLLLALAAPAALQEPIELREPSGAAVSFKPAEVPATMIAFISAVCPISNEYNARYRALYERFHPSGVRFLFVYSNRNESDASVARHAARSRFPFPVYRDLANRLADALDAQVTPTTYVLDSAGRIVYSGAIDDAVTPARVRNHYIADALAAALANRPPSPVLTATDGCTIKRGTGSRPAPLGDPSSPPAKP